MIGFAMETISKVAEVKTGFYEIGKKPFELQELREDSERYGISGNKIERASFLTEIQEERQAIREISPYSDSITNRLYSVQEAEFYIDKGMIEGEINGRKCLKNPEIDWNRIDEDGQTNMQRAELGKAPIANNGERYELHHVGGQQDSPLAELTTSEHRGENQYTILHETGKESEVLHGNNFREVRQSYWKARAQEIAS
ncbi:MAG: HNH/ENDO VII family nuclease [Helicobacter sp.]|nr:HNH/ENDO VII family nuclease [Helicobacter sp.]